MTTVATAGNPVNTRAAHPLARASAATVPPTFRHCMPAPDQSTRRTIGMTTGSQLRHPDTMITAHTTPEGLTSATSTTPTTTSLMLASPTRTMR